MDKRKELSQEFNRTEKEAAARVRQTGNILSFVLMPKWTYTAVLGQHRKSGKAHRLYYTSMNTCWKAGPGARALVLLSPPSPQRRLLTKPTGPFLCAFLWLSRLQKLQRTVLTVALGSLLWKLYKKIPPRIIQIDGISFKDFLLALVYRKKATPFENYMQLGVLFKSLS